MAESGTRFVVKRLRWAEDYNGRRTRQPGGVAVASFATFDEADAERAKREEAARKNANPFECGTAVQYWSHLDEPRLRDWLLDHGIDPPAPGKGGTTDWAAWWKKGHKKLSADNHAVVWEALDKVRFFAVSEEPARPVGFAVVQVNWEYNDEYYETGAEGGNLLRVFRTRERAEEECASLNEEAREEWGDIMEDFGDFDDEFDDEADLEYGMFDMQDRIRHRRGLTDKDKLKKGEGLFNSPANVPFFEVIEVELEGLA